MNQLCAREALVQIENNLRFDEELGRFFWKTPRQGRNLKEPVGGFSKDGYRHFRFCGASVFEHRLVWLLKTGKWPNGEIDHINGNVSDNRFCNLRDVSRVVNQQNQRKAHKDNRSGLIGAAITNKGNFRAEIQVNGVRKNLGRHKTAKEAHAVYLSAKRSLHQGCTI